MPTDDEKTLNQTAAGKRHSEYFIREFKNACK